MTTMATSENRIPTPTMKPNSLNPLKSENSSDRKATAVVTAVVVRALPVWQTVSTRAASVSSPLRRASR